MHFRTRLLAAGVVLFLVGGNAPVQAGEPPAPAGPTPAERAEKVLAALPAPSASEPWTFEADLFINDELVGSGRFTLTATKEGDADLWKASDGIRIGPLEKPAMTIAMETLLDRSLTTLSGTTVSAAPEQGTITLSWKRTPLGYGLERKEGEKEAERLMLRDAPYLKTSLSGLVRFLRAVPPEPATYAVQVLTQDVNVGMTREARVHDTTVEVLGVKPFKIGGSEREAWVVRTAQGKDDERFLAFDPKDRRLLTVTKPSNRLEVRRKGLEVAGKPAEATAIDWKGPAKSAEVAALQAARAFATGDLEALDKVIWWPSAHEGLKKDPDLAALDDEARKATILAGLKESLPKNPPTLIEFALQGARKDLVVEDAGGGRKRVKFPAMFQSLELLVVEAEGAWYLAELPMSAPPEKEKPPEAPPTPETPK